MKLKQTLILLSILTSGCSSSRSEPMSQVIDRAFNRAYEQASRLASQLKTDSLALPRTTDAQGRLVTSDSRWWTSGFFPGTLWYLFEYTHDRQILELARDFTARVEREQYTTDNHDIGFILNCSFGNGYRLTGDEQYRAVLLQGASSLATRFRPLSGVIQSWDIAPWSTRLGWQCPVIIDNMMNLELLTRASELSGDPHFREMAVAHAETTLKNHFRKDHSSYHVVSYDTLSGRPHLHITKQGYSDSSAWARGQAWALYGFSMMYRETGEERYLQQAELIADFLLRHPRLPEDMVPYWDFDAPDIPDAPRDASAAAVMASAFVELSQASQDPEAARKYREAAQMQIRSLAADTYLAAPGTNGGFILKHSVGSLPDNSEVDVPLTYADYYFLEAMLRYKAAYPED